MKGRYNLLILSACILASLTHAEEMKFQYQLAQNQNICFLQNIAENVQGKCHWSMINVHPKCMKLIWYVCLYSHYGSKLWLGSTYTDCQWSQRKTTCCYCNAIHALSLPSQYRTRTEHWDINSLHSWVVITKFASITETPNKSHSTSWFKQVLKQKTTAISSPKSISDLLKFKHRKCKTWSNSWDKNLVT